MIVRPNLNGFNAVLQTSHVEVTRQDYCQHQQQGKEVIQEEMVEAEEEELPQIKRPSKRAKACQAVEIEIIEIDSSLENDDVEREQKREANNIKSHHAGTDDVGDSAGDDIFSSYPDGQGPQLLCVGGFTGAIYVIDLVRKRKLKTLIGHGHQILDLQVCPVHEWLLLSTSQDESARIWDLRSSTPLWQILAGHFGHRDLVISAAWHGSGTMVATGGMDTEIKLWKVDPAERADVTATAKNPMGVTGNRSRPERQHIPIFSTSRVHVNCVDSIHFLGDLILTKSIDADIVLWTPEPRLPNPTSIPRNQSSSSSSSSSAPEIPLPNQVIALRKFSYKNADVWFTPMAVNHACTLIAVGNKVGQVYVWNLDQPGNHPIAKLSIGQGRNGNVSSSSTSTSSATMNHSAAPGKTSGHKRVRPCDNTEKRPAVLRSLSFSPDDKCLIASGDASFLCKWDIISLTMEEAGTGS